MGREIVKLIFLLYFFFWLLTELGQRLPNGSQHNGEISLKDREITIADRKETDAARKVCARTNEKCSMPCVGWKDRTIYRRSPIEKIMSDGEPKPTLIHLPYSHSPCTPQQQQLSSGSAPMGSMYQQGDDSMSPNAVFPFSLTHSLTLTLILSPFHLLSEFLVFSTLSITGMPYGNLMGSSGQMLRPPSGAPQVKVTKGENAHLYIYFNGTYTYVCKHMCIYYTCLAVWIV